MKNIYVLLFFLVGYTSLQAQDVHFTYFEFSPLLVNPALTGGFEGTYRVNAIYRDQNITVNSSGRYKTPNLTLDLPVIRGFRQQDWVGLGISILQDNSSQLNLSQFRSSQSLAYHFGLDKKQNSVFSIGIQQSISKRSLKDIENLRTETLILTQEDITDRELINMAEADFNDWAGGITYRTYFDKNTYFRTGLSVGRIYRKNQSLVGQNDVLRIKYTGFAELDVPLTNRIFLNPQLLYQRTSANQELVLQAEGSYWLNQENDLFLNAGLGYRVGDALQVLLGADYKNWKFGLSYDININKFIPATNGVGGMELAVTYIGRVYKKPEIDPTVICPRL